MAGPVYRFNAMDNEAYHRCLAAVVWFIALISELIGVVISVLRLCSIKCRSQPRSEPTSQQQTRILFYYYPVELRFYLRSTQSSQNSYFAGAHVVDCHLSLHAVVTVDPCYQFISIATCATHRDVMCHCSFGSITIIGPSQPCSNLAEVRRGGCRRSTRAGPSPRQCRCWLAPNAETAGC